MFQKMPVVENKGHPNGVMNRQTDRQVIPISKPVHADNSLFI